MSLRSLPDTKGPKPCDLYWVAARAFAPPANQTVSEWADENRVLSGESAAEPGPWRTSRAPYTKEPMDCFSDPGVETVTLMWASQLGKTEILLNVIGYFIDVDPCPMLWVEPTVPLIRDYSITRLDPMVKSSGVLNRKVIKHKSREAGSNTLQKKFPGGFLKMVGAQSPTDLSGRPIRVVLFDEQDRPGPTSEGDPEDLVKRRTSNFWNRKLGNFSSPGKKGASRIERNYLAGDQRQLWVPCPSCGTHQVLRWSCVVLGQGFEC
jgi:phage terminase large subunit GpA-like protein